MAQFGTFGLFLAIFLSSMTAIKSINNCSACPPSIPRLEVLPGHGFDTIRNKEMGRVLQLTYDECRTTEDGRYLIPDDIYVIAVKDSVLHRTSEYIDHYMNYSSVTSRSMRINAEFNIFGLVSVQASFDDDFQAAKRRQVEEKSITTRISMRNNLYVVESSPSPKIDKTLRKMLEQICEATDSKNFEKAELLCEFVVRNYGTHYVYQANAGAILLQEDYVRSSFTSQSGVDKLKIQAAAGASFFTTFAGAKYSYKVDHAFLENYESNRTSSTIRSIGGALISANMTVDDWIKQIPNNLVVIDRSGNPLSFLMTPESFPKFSVNTVNAVRKRLDRVVKDYYSYNTHSGCTDVNSVNFDYNANVDSGKCHKPPNGYHFGGGYVTCTSKLSNAGDLCEHLNVKNPLTGGFRCEDGYDAVPLTGNVLRKEIVVTECHEECPSWYEFWKSCQTECPDVVRRSEGSYKGYWCVSKSKPGNNTGFMFGGLYTKWTNNPVTKTRSCPVSFIPLTFAPGLKVCVSNEYDVGFKYSVPFGGFFSCQYGNPLTSTLKLATNGSGFLHTCPDGYSQRMAMIDNECEINYCVKLASTFQQIDVILPPFRDESATFSSTPELRSSLKAAVKGDAKMSGGAVAGVVLGAVVCVGLAGVGVVVMKRRRARVVGEDAERDRLMPTEYGAMDEDVNN